MQIKFYSIEHSMKHEKLMKKEKLKRDYKFWFLERNAGWRNSNSIYIYIYEGELCQIYFFDFNQMPGKKILKIYFFYFIYYLKVNRYMKDRSVIINGWMKATTFMIWLGDGYKWKKKTIVCLSSSCLVFTSNRKKKKKLKKNYQIKY